MVVISYLLTMMAFIFWGLRIIVAMATKFGSDFPITCMDINMEIILLFVTLFSLIFIVRRRIIGALIYLISYVGYFGTFLYKTLQTEVTIDQYLNIFVMMLGIFLGVSIFFDIGLNRNRKEIFGTKKTDWFFKNEQFDRKLDERADTNQYKF